MYYDLCLLLLLIAILGTTDLDLRVINYYITVATLLQAHPPGWAFECLGPNVQLELEPTLGGLIIQSERYITVGFRLLVPLLSDYLFTPKRHYESPNSTPLWGGLAKLMIPELGT